MLSEFYPKVVGKVAFEGFGTAADREYTFDYTYRTNVDRPPHKLHLGLLRVGRKMAFEWTDRTGDAGVFIIERYHSVD